MTPTPSFSITAGNGIWSDPPGQIPRTIRSTPSTKWSASSRGPRRKGPTSRSRFSTPIPNPPPCYHLTPGRVSRSPRFRRLSLGGLPPGRASRHRDPLHPIDVHERLSARKSPAGGPLPPHQQFSRICGIQEYPAPTRQYPPSFGDEPALASPLPSLPELPLPGADGKSCRPSSNSTCFREAAIRQPRLANRKRIKGIEGLDTKPSDRLVSGVVMRGQEIRLKIRQDHFASPGDLFLFGCVMDHFLGGYASINTFTRTDHPGNHERRDLRWPARVGDHPLI